MARSADLTTLRTLAAFSIFWLSVAIGVIAGFNHAWADNVDANPWTTVRLGETDFRVANGWKVERAAELSLIRYPIHADVAADGRLFVVESSGSNAPVKQQVIDRPHRLVVLEDTNGDGTYDSRTLFADGLMLPQGVLWTPDGVLVASPPEIWRYRDTTGDGVADERTVWFDGKTLTGCANDLHGPFMGRDGWVHWCKGAFAEQSYKKDDGTTWSTRASHVLRMHPRTGTIESVMTGGMDNPVEFATSLCGERFFTCTFIQHPADGKRDALVHSVYGGVYGKDHGVLEGHPRTGALMPVLTHLGPAAPAGLTLRESSLTDDNLLGELLVAQFNLQRVSRHQLVEDGAALRTIDSDLLVSDRPDFHPTDVLEDHDGSLLVLDTGGWYTLCCPTSHIDQSKATGGIYRLTPLGNPLAAKPADMAWESLDSDATVQLLGDARPAVRQEASRRITLGTNGVDAVVNILSAPATADSPGSLMRVGAVWCAIELIGKLDPVAHAARREQLLNTLVNLLDDHHSVVRLVAVQGLGTHRHQAALPRLINLLETGGLREQRYAAEAIGRIGDSAAVAPLIAALAALDTSAVEDASNARSESASPESRQVLRHSLLFALIEIGPGVLPSLRLALADESMGPLTGPLAAAKRIAAMRVMDQLHDPELNAQRMLQMIRSGSDAERDLASEILGRSPAWDTVVATRLPELLTRQIGTPATESWRSTVQRLVVRPGLAVAVGNLIVHGPPAARDELLEAIAIRPPTSVPHEWIDAIATRLIAADADEDELRRWSKLVGAVSWKEGFPPSLAKAFTQAYQQSESNLDLWLAFASAAPPGVTWRGSAGNSDLSPGFLRLVAAIGAESAPARRQLATVALGRQPLLPIELQCLAESAAGLGPMEFSGILALLRPIHDEAVNRTLVASISASEQLAMLPSSLLEDHFREHPAPVREIARPLIERVSGDAAQGRQIHLKRLIDEMPAGDPLRGFQVFRSSKAACSACHAVGYFGGRIGPDLTRINRIRTAQDLIEAIVYPSASFVRSYESIQVMTDDGRVISGLIADEDAQSITLTTGIDQRVRVDRDEIEAIRPSAVSIMPAGLDQQLSPQELADLIAFLKSER